MIDIELERGNSLTNKEKVYGSLKEKIMRGQLVGGQQIRVSAIAKDMKVSGTPVREALIQLEGEGLISYEPYRGAIIKSTSREEVKEIFLIRSVLECLALETALKNMTNDEYEEAFRLAERGIDETDPDKRNAINWDFHSFVYKKASLPKLYEMIESLRGPIMRYVRIYHQVVDHSHHHSHHKEMIEAGMKGEYEKAASILRKSLVNASEKISNFVSD